MYLAHHATFQAHLRARRQFKSELLPLSALLRSSATPSVSHLSSTYRTRGCHDVTRCFVVSGSACSCTCCLSQLVASHPNERRAKFCTQPDDCARSLGLNSKTQEDKADMTLSMPPARRSLHTMQALRSMYVGPSLS